jgi:hypothetical protein
VSALSYDINETNVRSLLSVVDAGLVNGLGKPVPGQMCVEAAVCYAMGLPHSDEPLCVGPAVRAFKIRLNDSAWSSNEARAKGMRRIAVAQLGSENIDQQAFRRIVAEGVTRQIVPIALRAAASVNPKHAETLEACAVRCEQEGSVAALREARNAAYAAAAAADAADAAYAAAHAAAHAAYAERDRILTLAADIAERALIELNSPGCAYLYLCEAKP